jgi:hypothetical protein
MRTIHLKDNNIIAIEPDTALIRAIEKAATHWFQNHSDENFLLIVLENYVYVKAFRLPLEFCLLLKAKKDPSLSKLQLVGSPTDNLVFKRLLIEEYLSAQESSGEIGSSSKKIDHDSQYKQTIAYFNETYGRRIKERLNLDPHLKNKLVFSF